MTSNGKTKSKDLVPIYKRGPELDMSIFEREIGRILNKMRELVDRGDGTVVTRGRDEDTVPAIQRAIETYEAATR